MNPILILTALLLAPLAVLHAAAAPAVCGGSFVLTTLGHAIALL